MHMNGPVRHKGSGNKGEWKTGKQRRKQRGKRDLELNSFCSRRWTYFIRPWSSSWNSSKTKCSTDEENSMGDVRTFMKAKWVLLAMAFKSTHTFFFLKSVVNLQSIQINATSQNVMKRSSQWAYLDWSITVMIIPITVHCITCTCHKKPIVPNHKETLVTVHTTIYSGVNLTQSTRNWVQARTTE